MKRAPTGHATGERSRAKPGSSGARFVSPRRRRGRCHRRARQNALRAGGEKSLPCKDSNALARARSSGIDIGYRIRQENIDRATADWYRRYTSALPPVVGFDHGLRTVRARRISSTHRARNPAPTRRSIDAGRARERVRPPPRGERAATLIIHTASRTTHASNTQTFMTPTRVQYSSCT